MILYMYYRVCGILLRAELHCMPIHSNMPTQKNSARYLCIFLLGSLARRLLGLSVRMIEQVMLYWHRIYQHSPSFFSLVQVAQLHASVNFNAQCIAHGWRPPSAKARLQRCDRHTTLAHSAPLAQQPRVCFCCVGRATLECAPCAATP